MKPHGVLDRVTWESVHFLGKDAAEREADWGSGVFVAIDLGGVESTRGLMERLAEGLRFPEYFGRNWDALHDCLCDLNEWIPADGYTVQIRRAGGFWRRSPLMAGRLVEAWLSAAEFMGTHWNKPMHLVFVME